MGKKLALTVATETESAGLDVALDKFPAEDDLITLCELQRTGDEVLDVISLSENQQSDILGWLLYPREGHGKGDQILRDLLITASMKVVTGESCLDGRSTTAKFLKKWPPSRIRTTGFGSPFYARELGMKASERVDLFVIDPQNKFILLIENKKGVQHRDDQLRQYRTNFGETVAEDGHLREYDEVCIAVDRDFDYEDSLTVHARMRGSTSATTGLKPLPVVRSAVFIRSALYNKSTNGGINRSHEKEWLKRKNPDSSLLFMLQNKNVIELLRETRGMASVKTDLHAKLPHVPLSSFQDSRAWVDVCPSRWEQPEGALWPVFMNIRFTDQAKTKFRIRLVWDSRSVSDASDAQEQRQRLTQAEPRFAAFNESLVRRVVISTGC